MEIFLKNPNKFGTVTKLTGNRRRPYQVREGKSGQQKTIGYAATREEGLIMLAQYNKKPWDIDSEKVTFEELHKLWLEKRVLKLGIANQKALKTAYNHCKPLLGIKYSDIKPYQMQDIIDNCGGGHSLQASIKNLFWHLDRFALELDVANNRYSSLLTIAPIPETTKTIFTETEIATLWENEKLEWVDSVLFFLYTGFRISEMLELKTESVDLKTQIMTGGVKTAAGKNRIVPIHSKIRHIVESRYNSSKQGYLFEDNGKILDQTRYRTIWRKTMKKLEMQHTPHETRHTFRSRLDSAGANKVCIDRIMGHKSKDVGERIYTHKTIEELKQNIELLLN